MKMIKLGLAAAALSMTVPTNVAAQEYPMKAGEFVEVSYIKIDDGHTLEYAKHLAGVWKKDMDFAVEQGWVNSYEVLVNSYARPGEPSVYLITRFPNFATEEENEAREAAYRAYAQTTISEAEAGSAERAKYRTVMGSQLLRKYTFSN